MYRLSQKADYGLILLFNLKKYPKENVSVSKVAQKNKISPKYLSQIANELKKAGVLESKEGVNGGYKLAKPAEKIKILDILKILDGGLVTGECFEDEHECNCGAKGIWGNMRKQMEEAIGTKTVADLVV